MPRPRMLRGLILRMHALHPFRHARHNARNVSRPRRHPAMHAGHTVMRARHAISTMADSLGYTFKAYSYIGPQGAVATGIISRHMCPESFWVTTTRQICTPRIPREARLCQHACQAHREARHARRQTRK